MANPLKRFIEKQLKENVPLSEIKKDLQEKGYGLDVINKAVREVISGVKTISTPSKKVFLLLTLVLLIIINLLIISRLL